MIHITKQKFARGHRLGSPGSTLCSGHKSEGSYWEVLSALPVVERMGKELKEWEGKGKGGKGRGGEGRREKGRGGKERGGEKRGGEGRGGEEAGLSRWRISAVK